MRANLLLLSLSLAGCGQPLVNGDYRGEVLYSFSGNVRLDGIDSWDERLNGNLRVALFWASDSDAQTLEERQEQAVVAITDFPARYTLELYEPPPNEVLFQASWADGATIGVATPLLYSDDNDDGRWDPSSEELMGGSGDMAMVYVLPGTAPARPSAPMMSEPPPFVEVEEGYQMMYAGVDYCGELPASQTVYFPSHDDPVDLWVGELWGGFTDWNCDGVAAEWDQACPSPDEMPDLCDPMGMSPDAVDPFLVECGIVCPEPPINSAPPL